MIGAPVFAAASPSGDATGDLGDGTVVGGDGGGPHTTYCHSRNPSCCSEEFIVLSVLPYYKYFYAMRTFT